MYAITHKKTGAYIYGTDYRYSTPHQRTSTGKALIFETKEEAEFEFRRRRCSSAYKIQKIQIEKINE